MGIRKSNCPQRCPSHLEEILDVQRVESEIWYDCPGMKPPAPQCLCGFNLFSDQKEKKLIYSPVASFGDWLHRPCSIPADTPLVLTAFPVTLQVQKNATAGDDFEDN